MNQIKKLIPLILFLIIITKIKNKKCFTKNSDVKIKKPFELFNDLTICPFYFIRQTFSDTYFGIN